MAAKAILVLCAQALLAQVAFSCPAGLGGIAGNWAGYNGWNGAGLAGYGAGCGCGGVASTGGGLPTASASPVAPVGVSLLSENAYEGSLCAGGNMPFLGTVGIQGVLPTAGAGAVSYGCGNGAVAIGSEGPIATGIAGPGIYPPSSALAANGIAGYGIGGYGLGGTYGYGLSGIAGCGCNGLI